MNSNHEISSAVGASRSTKKIMVLKIKKPMLSDPARGKISRYIGNPEKSKAFIALSESNCKFFQSISLNPIEYRSAAKIRGELKKAFNAISPILEARDTQHHLSATYRKLYPKPKPDFEKIDLGWIDAQDETTAIFRPDKTIPPDDGWWHDQVPEEVDLLEMLERVNES